MARRPLEGRPTHQAHTEFTALLDGVGLEATVRGVLVGSRPSYLDETVETILDPHVNLSARLGWTPLRHSGALANWTGYNPDRRQGG